MNWTELLTAKVNETYHAIEGMLSLCDDASLGWKPATGANWMTTGQLIDHLTNAGGSCIAGFVAGKWPMPEGASVEEMLPSAERMPTAKSVAETRTKLAADKALALAMIAEAGEQNLATKMVAAPWNPQPALLGLQCLGMVDHLANHKAQLFYYLKLQGKPVHTGHLYGM
ncbi:MAG: DinB family protein [Planctomycetes bacterium]|nr:DinB family protein [Planctomycetota bacterium]